MSIPSSTRRDSNQRVYNPRLYRIYSNKYDHIPQFIPHARKSEGCALGTIFIKVSTKPGKESKQWIGKVGQPEDYTWGLALSPRTRARKRLDIEVIREKLASDAFEELADGSFILPKTSLSEQELVNDFMPSKMPPSTFFIIHRKEITSCLRIMSQFVEGYQDFKKASVLDHESHPMPFLEYLATTHRPPTHILTPEGKEVPLHGIMEMLAVGRVLADTDILGGDGDNAGFVWLKENEQIIAAKAVKIDPGCAFNFTHDERFTEPSPNWVINTHKQLANGKMLKNLKDLQVAQNYYPLTIHWDALSSTQQETFLTTLIYANRYTKQTDALEFLFYREGEFKELPQEMAQKWQHQMEEWLDLQLEIYRDEIAIFCQNPQSLEILPDQECSFDNCFKACQSGDFAQLKRWIQENPVFLDQENAQGETLLYGAVLGGHLEILKWLHTHNPSQLSKCRKDGWTLMHVAADKNNAAIVVWLNKLDKQLIHHATSDLTPLQLAIFSERLNIVKLFLDQIKDPEWLKQIVQRSCTQILALLLDQGLSPNFTDSSGQTLLHLAAETGEASNIALLLSKEASIDALDQSKRSPLYIATLHGHIEPIKILLNQGANPILLGNEEDTLLHIAAFYGHIHLIKLFLKDSRIAALLNSKDFDGKEPIHKAVWGTPKPDVISLLLAHGANPNATNGYDYTPLHWAAKHGHAESAILLLQAGASIENVNRNHDLPFDLAVKFEEDDFFHIMFNTTQRLNNLIVPEKTEAICIERFLEAKAQNLIEEQILYLLKISDFYIEQGNLFQATKLCNQALAFNDTRFTAYLLARLEQIEARFLTNNDIKTPIQKESLSNYRAWLKNIRSEHLQQQKPIFDLLSAFSNSYKNLLGSLILDAQSQLGPAPTNWVCIGMGSMSHNEMFPYDSLKITFLIHQSTHKSYFQTLAKFVEIKCINLGETFFSLSNESEIPNGFSMSCNSLITTPQLFAQQITQEASFDLIEMISTVCPIAGDHSLLTRYETAKRSIFDTRIRWSLFSPTLADLLAHQLLSYHATVMGEPLESLQGILNGLAILFNLKSKSTRGRIHELMTMNIFCEAGAANLQSVLEKMLSIQLQVQTQNLQEIEELNQMQTLSAFRKQILEFCQTKDQTLLAHDFNKEL